MLTTHLRSLGFAAALPVLLAAGAHGQRPGVAFGPLLCGETVPIRSAALTTRGAITLIPVAAFGDPEVDGIIRVSSSGEDTVLIRRRALRPQVLAAIRCRLLRAREQAQAYPRAAVVLLMRRGDHLPPARTADSLWATQMLGNLPSVTDRNLRRPALRVPLVLPTAASPR